MKKYLILPLIAIAFSSCATQELYLNITRPAPVTIAPEIKTVGIIDRSTPTDRTKTLDALDRVLSLEGADLDSIGTLEAIKGVNEELEANDRFQEVKLLSKLEFQASSLGGLPAPLTWDQVEGICRDNGTQALFALEMYDTDTRIGDAGGALAELSAGNLQGALRLGPMETLVKTGWRIYSPNDRAILDEFIVAESIVFGGRGGNPVAAVSGMIHRKDAVKEVSRKAGNVYAMRLIPYRLRVDRDYYVKGTDNFKTAKRLARLGKWDEAGELWNLETDNPKRKVAGRAHYNMAIISEINGDLDNAVSWAQKAYSNYRIKKGLHYVRILENRQYEQDLIRYQEER
ncbi:MAG: DUF6340 family protein [Bacteroidales bacterium]|jgi:hypothetical protein|nr:DUF6340 family protein [Bacteroidales bacterium]